jgi:2'-5' RNA ligase
MKPGSPPRAPGAAERTLRLFAALPLPARTRAVLEEYSSLLPGGYFRPLKTENLHLTLAFLGDTPEDRVPEIEVCLRDACAGLSSFEGSLGGFGAFPHGGEPRVVWAGLAGGAVQSAALAEAFRCGLRRAGVPFDRKPFKAHITIAYARRDLGREGLRKAGAAFMEFLKARGRESADAGTGRAVRGEPGSGAAPEADRFRFDEVLLMRSDLGPGGSVFTPLCRAPLGGLPSPAEKGSNC